MKFAEIATTHSQLRSILEAIERRDLEASAAVLDGLIARKPRRPRADSAWPVLHGLVRFD
jgi:DNA-binding GntR family transcriptional regulator